MDELDVLQKRIRQQMNEIADVIATGGCKDFEHYQRLCGFIDGLAYAERELLDIKGQNEE